MNARTLFSAAIISTSVLFAAGCTSQPQNESTSEYLDDAKITTRVKAAIFNDEVLKSHQINVETFRRTVQLSGFVNTSADISRAGALARSVTGVNSVSNDIRLK